jgi:hypothetical protein
VKKLSKPNSKKLRPPSNTPTPPWEEEPVTILKRGPQTTFFQQYAFDPYLKTREGARGGLKGGLSPESARILTGVLTVSEEMEKKMKRAKEQLRNDQ